MNTWSIELKLKDPHGCTVTPQKTMLVCDTNNHQLREFSLTGEWRRSIMPGQDQQNFLYPWNVDVCQNDKILVAEDGNHRLIQLFLDGKVTIYRFSTTRTFSPGGVAVLHDMVTGQSNHQIHVIQLSTMK